MKNMAWIPIPNKHDGDGYTTLVARKNGAALLGAWLVILQVASRCDPRGTLLRSGRKAHDPQSIARITRLPPEILKEALDVCSTEIDWIEVVTLTTIPQEPEENPQDGAVSTHPTDEEGKGTEGKGREGNGSTAHFPESPTWKEFWEFCQSLQCGLLSEPYAREKFMAAEQVNWSKQPNWKSYAIRCKIWWQQDGSPMDGKRNKKPKAIAP